MACYKDLHSLYHFDGDMFKADYQPGEHTLYAGIYRCDGCGKEIAHHANASLPTQHHHPQVPSHGLIRWKLIVWAMGG